MRTTCPATPSLAAAQAKSTAPPARFFDRWVDHDTWSEWSPDIELVRRDQHPTDGRATVISVTTAGRELANRSVAAVEACDTEFFATLGPATADFAELLGRLVR